MILARKQFALTTVLCVITAAGCLAQTEGAAAQEDKSRLRASAFAAKNKKDFGKAADLFLSYLKLDSTDPEMHLHAGSCLEKAKRFNDALETLEAATKRFPDVIALDAAIVRTLSLKAAQQIASSGLDMFASSTLGECVRRAKTVLDRDPNQRETRLLKANAHYRLGQPKKTRTEADELVKRFPRHPGAHIILGDLAFDQYRDLHKKSIQRGADRSKEAMLRVVAARDLARKRYKTALSLDKNRVAAHVQLGNLDGWNANKNGALGHYRKALAIRPTAKIPHGWVGQNTDAKARGAFYRSAAKDYQAAHPKAKDADFAVLLWYAASAEYHAKNWQTAEQLFRRSALANKSYVSGAFWAMHAAYNQSSIDRALLYCKEYARRAPIRFADELKKLKPESWKERNIKLVNFLATEAYKGQKLDASRDISHVLAAVEDTSEKWNNYAFLSRETQRYKQSLLAYENAYQVEKTSAQVMNDMAVILDYHLGTAEQIRQAETVYRRDLERAGRYVPKLEFDLANDAAVRARARKNLRRAAKLYRSAITTAKKKLKNKKKLSEAEYKREALALRDATNNLAALKKRL